MAPKTVTRKLRSQSKILTYQLWILAESRARRLRHHFNPQTANMMYRFIENAVRRLPEEPPAKRQRAIKDLRRNTEAYVNLMVRHSVRTAKVSRRRSDPPSITSKSARPHLGPFLGISILRKQNFLDARKSFCPCFPFC
jgi:hypothetical protein